MKTKKITSFIIAIFILAFTISCTKDSTPATGSLALKAKATLTKTAAKSSATAKTLSSLNITSFKINIKNIEFGVNEMESEHEHMNTNPNDSIYHSMELSGPFLLDLSTGSTSVDIANINMPNNIYNRVQFEIHKSTDPNSPIFGKSIEIKGDINGTPFIFWTDAEEEMHVNFNATNTNIVVNGTTTSTTINFDLSAIFGATSTIDFSTAVDGNGDGIIEISPNNIDGNADLAHLIKKLLEEGSDLEND